MINSFKFLLDSVLKLGPRQGFTYWRIYGKAKKDPELVLRWADTCDRLAAKLEFFNQEPDTAKACRDWAETLRFYYQKSQKETECYAKT